MTIKERIEEAGKEKRSKDWVDWAGNKYSVESWENSNPVSTEGMGYVFHGLFTVITELEERIKALEEKLHSSENTPQSPCDHQCHQGIAYKGNDDGCDICKISHYPPPKDIVL